MKRSSGTHRNGAQPPAAGRARLPCMAVLLLLLAACSPEGDMPKPPPSTPRPTTSGHYGGGHAITLQLDLAKRPVPPPPGPM